MGLAVTTPTNTVLLTTIEQAKTEIGVSVATHDPIFDTFVRQAGDMADKYCRRVFMRQKYTETVGAFGTPYFSLSQAPVLVLHSSTYKGDTLTDVSIADAGEGLLYRRGGFFWTAQGFGAGGLGSGLFLSRGIPIPLTEEPDYVFVHTSGYLTRAHDLCAKSTLSASVTDDSFNDSASGFPPLIQSGDIVEASGFTNAANNGRHVVSGTPTIAKIVVGTTLVTESAAKGRTILFSTLPGDVERSILEIVKSLYAQRATDSMLIEKQLGPARVRYSENRGSGAIGLPPTAAALLKPWIR
jgi:hypothetical protein